MDKIEKIRQEIERRLNILTNVYDELMERKDEEMMTYYHGKVIALEELCPFLGTLSEEPDKGLEEEIKRYIPRDQCPVPDFMEAVARHFAEWQKEQMLKNAVEGTMTNVGGSFGYDVLSAKYDDDHTITMCVPHEEGRKYGDKVKLIIVKEE